jgi:hypothetical protein
MKMRFNLSPPTMSPPAIAPCCATLAVMEQFDEIGLTTLAVDSSFVASDNITASYRPALIRYRSTAKRLISPCDS